MNGNGVLLFTTSKTFTTLSLFLVACIGNQVFGGHVPGKQKGELERFWTNQLPQTQMPEALRHLASTLQPSTTGILLTRLKEGKLLRFRQQLCATAEQYCTLAYVDPRVCIPPFFRYEYGETRCEFEAEAMMRARSSHIFFRDEELSEGKLLTHPDTTNDLQGRSFLPHLLASALPFTEGKLPELMSLFSVPTGSNMRRNMQDTLRYCASPAVRGELRECHTSVESMVMFVTKNQGTKLHIFVPSPMARLQANVKDVESLNSAGEKVTTCHDMMFPYLVYSCHLSTSLRVLRVTLETENGKTMDSIAVCHTDTSSWNPHRVAFEALNVMPGEGEVCHWVPENNFVWTVGE